MAMYIDETVLRSLPDAAGLTDEQSRLADQLVDAYCAHLSGNREKLDFFNDEVSCDGLDRHLPREIRNIKVSPGWCAKAVNMLARRSRYDGVIIEGESKETVERIANDNRLAMLYAMAVPSQLTFGGGFLTVGAGHDATEPDVVINYHDMLRSSGVWDYRHKRLKAGMVIEDLKQEKADQPLVPTFVVMHLEDCVIELEYVGKAWRAEVKKHDIGVPLMVAMRYNYSNWQPFGKSRISRSCRSITRQVIMETHNLIAHAKAYSLPTKVLSNLSESQFDAMKDNLAKAYATDMMLLTANDDGGAPNFSMHQPSGVNVHTEIIEFLARQFASETDLPLSAFGIQEKSYTSSDALRASSDDLIILCESLNASNGAALVTALQIALCIETERSFSDLTEEERVMSIKWIDPSMPSVASIADAMTKLASVVPEFGGTTVFWEKVGLDEDERRRVMADVRSNRGMSALNALFAKPEVTDETVA